MNGWAALLVVLTACGRFAFDELPPDAGEVPSCDNVVQDGDETGIDCGGSCGRVCVGETCGSDAECVTGRCVGVCELASGPPSWQAAPSMATARSYVQAATDSVGSIYVIGGTSAATGTGALATTEYLAWGAAAWLPGPVLNTPRRLHGAGAVDGVIYAHGGYDNSNTLTLSLEVLDTSSGWTRFSTAASNAGIAFVGADNSRLYVLDFNLQIYTPATNTFALAPQQTAVPRDSAAGAFKDGFVYEIGGHEEISNARVDNVDAFDIDAEQWTPRAPLPMPRGRLGAVTAPDGRIYAIGGEILGMGAVPVVEAYDPVGDRWITMPSMSTPRARVAVALGGDGRVYAIGGQSAGPTVLATAEAYGPVIALSAETARAGETLTVTASNFARDATLVVRIDGALVTTTATDGTGSALVDIVVPALPAGFHVVSAIDQRSQYRVQQPLTLE